MIGSWPLRFGAFFAPFHPVGQNPTLALEYDLDRLVALDRLGYDEVWIGEHHSGGYEIIACPEVFIAAAAERTRHVMLGTGVVSLPYHHPWLVADRLVLLDHLTRGRLVFGAGPGALPSDAFMLGIDPVDQRRMMDESLEAILALLRSDEPVTRETDWFTMRDCRLQVRPYTHPHFEVAVAAMVSPSGPRLAGTYGVSLLSLSMTLLDGFAAIGQAWGVVEEQARAAGRPQPDRRSWRVLGAVHLAETRDQAIEDCTYGLADFADYFGGGAGFVPLANQVDGGPRTPRAFVEAYAESGNVVIGTPDDAVAYIEGLLEQSGGFGTFLLLAHDWADPDATLRSYRLFAREVIPHFTGQLAAPRVSHEWAVDKRGELFGAAGQAILNAITSHVDETQAKAAEPMAVGRHAVNRSGIGAGDGAVVLGCGPVGLAVVAALRLLGVEPIVAADLSPARRSLAAVIGAHEVVDPAAEAAFEAWARVTRGRPPVVFEAIGVPGIIDGALRSAPAQSRIVVVGVCMQPDTVTPFFRITKELNLQFVFGYDPAEFEASLRSIADGEIDVTPLITGEVGLEGVPAAFDELADPERHCKILVVP